MEGEKLPEARRRGTALRAIGMRRRWYGPTRPVFEASEPGA